MHDEIRQHRHAGASWRRHHAQNDAWVSADVAKLLIPAAVKQDDLVAINEGTNERDLRAAVPVDCTERSEGNRLKQSLGFVIQDRHDEPPFTTLPCSDRFNSNRTLNL